MQNEFARRTHYVPTVIDDNGHETRDREIFRVTYQIDTKDFLVTSIVLSFLTFLSISALQIIITALRKGDSIEYDGILFIPDYRDVILTTKKELVNMNSDISIFRLKNFIPEVQELLDIFQEELEDIDPEQIAEEINLED